MIWKVGETLRSFLTPRSETSNSGKRSLSSERRDDPPVKRLRSSSGEYRYSSLSRMTSWMSEKGRQIHEGILNSPSQLIRKLSKLSTGEQRTYVDTRLQSSARNEGSDQTLQFTTDMMTTLAGVPVHSTPIRIKPAEAAGYNFTEANLDKPDKFNFLATPRDTFSSHTFVAPPVGNNLTRPPLRTNYTGGEEEYRAQHRAMAAYNDTTRPTNGTSVYAKFYGSKPQPRRRLRNHRFRHKDAANECFRMDQRKQYMELLQKYTTIPLTTLDSSKPQLHSTTNTPFTFNTPSVINTTQSFSTPSMMPPRGTIGGAFSQTRGVHTGTSKPANKVSKTLLGSPILHLNQFTTSHTDLNSSVQPSRSVTEPTVIARNRGGMVRRSPRRHAAPIMVDLTEGNDSEETSNPSTSGNKTQNKESLVRREPRPRRPPTSQEKLLDQCKYLKEDWLQGVKDRLQSSKKDLEQKVHAAEIEEKYRKEKREAWDNNLEKRIRVSLKISERIPPMVHDPYVELSDEEEEPEIDEFPVLTNEQEAAIDNALVPRPPTQKLVEGFRLELTRADLQTLNGLKWLNDEVINFYMNLLMERGSQEGNAKVHAFNTFFYPKVVKSGQSSVRRWTKKVDIFSMDYILVPVHLGMHWCLAVIDLKEKEIRYYDSMGGSNRQCLMALREYLSAEHLDKKKEKYDISPWSLVTVKDIPQQMNGSDCGMFACKFAEYITRDVEITFTQEHMPYFRRRMVYEILSKQLM